MTPLPNPPGSIRRLRRERQKNRWFNLRPLPWAPFFHREFRCVAVILGILGLAMCLHAASASPTSSPQALDLPGIENSFRVTARIYSGGQPTGEASFARLRELGIKTVLSVDGAKPDVEAATKFGLRYIHLPLGYGGISTNDALRLIKAAAVAEGPIFVHCHHGRHRAAAAVGVICQGTEGWIPGQAVQWMTQAGTAAEYTGLFRANAEFKSPPPEVIRSIPASFPEVAPVPSITQAMVEIDHSWDWLKAAEKAGWSMSNSEEANRLVSNALLLADAFEEISRTAGSDLKKPGFKKQLREAMVSARELHALLKTQPELDPLVFAKEAGKRMKRAGQSCLECHKKFRN